MHQLATSWATDEEGKLRNLVEDKASLVVIAGSLGNSLETVRSKIKRLGLVDDDREKKNLWSSSSITAELVLPAELFMLQA